jgi:ribulose-5-phosphate 4-epimerase/fuculose-1-phosphate aldolase
MVHVLITGAAGMIGRKLTQRLARDGKLAGREITALSLVDITRPEKPASFGGPLSLATLDVSDVAAVARCIAARPDFAVLLANHGPVVAGSSLDAAANAIEELEETAKLFLLLRGSNVRLLTETQVAALKPA